MYTLGTRDSHLGPLSATFPATQTLRWGHWPQSACAHDIAVGILEDVFQFLKKKVVSDEAQTVNFNFFCIFKSVLKFVTLAAIDWLGVIGNGWENIFKKIVASY